MELLTLAHHVIIPRNLRKSGAPFYCKYDSFALAPYRSRTLLSPLSRALLSRLAVAPCSCPSLLRFALAALLLRYALAPCSACIVPAPCSRVLCFFARCACAFSSRAIFSRAFPSRVVCYRALLSHAVLAPFALARCSRAYPPCPLLSRGYCSRVFCSRAFFSTAPLLSRA